MNATVEQLIKRHLRPAQEPIVEDDAFLKRALEFAGVPALMMSMIHMRGNASLLDSPLRPNTAILGEINGFMTPEDQATVRKMALEVVK